MDVRVIEQEIEKLKTEGKTSYENCERLITLEKALRYLSKDGGAPAHGSMTMIEAEAWVGRMKNADGTTGAHWTPEKTEQVRAQRGISCGPVEFWVAMNMMYSDYCEAAKKNSVNTLDFYADMARAFLDDPDARPDKLERYSEYVAAS